MKFVTISDQRSFRARRSRPLTWPIGNIAAIFDTSFRFCLSPELGARLEDAHTNIAATEGKIGQLDLVDQVLLGRLEPPDLYPECEIRPLLRGLLRIRTTRPTPDRSGRASPWRNHAGRARSGPARPMIAKVPI